MAALENTFPLPDCKDSWGCLGWLHVISFWTHSKPIVKRCFITTWERSVALESESSFLILKIYFRIQWLALLRTIILVNHLGFGLLKSKSELCLKQWTFWFALQQIVFCSTNQCVDAHWRQASKISAINCAQSTRLLGNAWQDTLLCAWYSCSESNSVHRTIGICQLQWLLPWISKMSF